MREKQIMGATEGRESPGHRERQDKERSTQGITQRKHFPIAFD